MINVKTFVFGEFQENTYLLSDETKDCVIIDPGCNSVSEIETFKTYISENNLIPQKIINTHGHIDHIFGVKKLMDLYEIPFFLHKEDEFLIENAGEMALMFGFQMNEKPLPSDYLSENENISFGNSELEVLHIPGHSPGSVVFYNSSNEFAIVGDVLFNGSIGRSDLPGGNHETLINGIKTKLLVLPRSTAIYSGHGPSTTIGKEHDTNPFLI